MPAPPEIRDLVARFEQHHESYPRGQYNETQLRRDYLHIRNEEKHTFWRKKILRKKEIGWTTSKLHTLTQGDSNGKPQKSNENGKPS